MMKFLICILFIGLMTDKAISKTLSDSCPNLTGLYKDGAETECYRSQDEQLNVHVYFCQNYKMIFQSGCETIRTLEKNVVVNPDSLFDKHLNNVESLKRSSFVIARDEFPINNASWKPEGSCDSGAVMKTKSFAEENGYLLRVFSCYRQEFNEIRLSLVNSILDIQERLAQGHSDPAVPGPWSPWSLKFSLKKAEEFPQFIWRPYTAGQFFGDFTLEFASSDWRAAIGYQYHESKNWMVLNTDEVQKMLSALDKSQKYNCSFKAMTLGEYPYMKELLVQTIENCRVKK